MVNYERLNELLDKHGVKKAHICRVLGMNRGWLNNKETKGRDISEDRLKIIAEMLGTTPDYLRGSVDSPDINDAPAAKDAGGARNEIDERLVAMLVRLPPEQEQRVLDFVAGMIAGT